MNRMKSLIKISVLLVVIVTLASCKKDSAPNYQFMPNMYAPISYETFGESKAFANGIEAQLSAEGTISRGHSLFEYDNTIEGYTLAKETLKNPLSQEGVSELENVFEVVGYGSNLNQVKTNFTIVRGLAYYSDFIVETNLNFKVTNNKGKEVDIGSICSGGAYAKLISRFRGVDIPGTGISFGVDRLLFALMQLDQIKLEDQKPVLVCVMDQKYLKNYYELVDQLRNNNINAEVFLNTKKNLGKQLDLANKRQLTVAVICGENEFNDNTLTLKNLKGVKGENNQTIQKADLINEIKKLI